MTIPLKSIAMILSLNAYAGLVLSANVTEVNRYATVANKPLASQLNPLLSVQQIHFPQSIKTVGEGLTYWLQYSGYALVDPTKRSMALNEVLQKPLPQVDRSLGPLTIEDGLLVLVGKTVFTPVFDSLHRTVNFKLRDQVMKGVSA